MTSPAEFPDAHVAAILADPPIQWRRLNSGQVREVRAWAAAAGDEDLVALADAALARRAHAGDANARLTAAEHNAGVTPPQARCPMCQRMTGTELQLPDSRDPAAASMWVFVVHDRNPDLQARTSDDPSGEWCIGSLSTARIPTVPA